MVFLCCNIPQPTSDFDWVQFWSNTALALISVLAILFSYLQYKSGLNSEKRKEKTHDIQRKLNEFYGPFLQLRKKSDILYDRFQKKFRDQDPNFSTLRYLMRGNKFEGNDKKLLEEITKIGSLCEDLIHSKAGLIDDENLRTNILPKLTTHYLLLRLAFEGTLVSEDERFNNLTFPREVDGIIEQRFRELEAELVKLQ
jgi:hypothetical protein